MERIKEQILSFNPIALRKAKIVYNFGLPSATGLRVSLH